VNDANPRWQYAEGGPDRQGQDPYAQDPDQQDSYPQDPQAQQQGDYGYDPYAEPQQYPQQYGQQEQQYPQYQQQGYAEPYYPDQQQQQQEYQQQEYQQYPGFIPQQPQYAAQQPYYEEPPAAPEPESRQQPPHPEAQRSGGGRDGDEGFAFVDEDDAESDEVIDWLKFSESRTERREEARRRGRSRVIALVVVMALAVVGGLGYLWQTGRLPGFGSTSTAAQTTTAQRRDVIVLHLRPVDSNQSSTALLVTNSTTKKATTVLLPNSLAVSTDDGGSTTLGASVVSGSTPTRDALDTLLGTKIAGTWRLDTPYLELLVQSLGDITVDTDVTVISSKKDGAKTLVNAGKAQDLNGQAAVAYATYRGPGEAQSKQLDRFGQVMEAVLKKFPSSTDLATKTIQSLNAIIEPPLTEKDLGATLAVLAEEAKTGSYTTTTLPVQSDGTLSETATNGVVKDVLGGTVKNASSNGVPTVSVKNATGVKDMTIKAQAAVVNSGYTYVSAGTATTQALSQVTYADAAQKANATELAKTLGLSAKVVKKAAGAANADITVVIGTDYKG
jgi:anionic cell wall polymer biosynthesis LytR-Cps2A-Psr (LCP) family protein